MLRKNLWKTQAKRMFCVKTTQKHKENTGVAWEPIENTTKTFVLRRNIWSQGKHGCCVGTYGNNKENPFSAREQMETKTQGEQKCCVGTY